MDATTLSLAMQDCSCFTEDEAEKWAPHVAAAYNERAARLQGDPELLREDTAKLINRARWSGAYDALTVVRGLNGDGFHEPRDDALSAAEEAIKRMIVHRHGPEADAALAASPPEPEPLDLELDQLGQRIIRDLTSFLLSSRLVSGYELARAHAEGFVFGQPDLTSAYNRLSEPAATDQ